MLNVVSCQRQIYGSGKSAFGGKKGLIALLLVASFSFAAAWPKFVKPEEITPGRWGYGFTTFEGYSPQRFEIKVLGLENWWLGLTSTPVVMAKCYGGPKGYYMPYIGVAQGMSGSPIYIYTKDGPKLLGALAYGMWFNKDPICGVTLAQKMLEEGEKEIIEPVSRTLINHSTLLPIVLSGPFSCPDALKKEFANKGLSVTFSLRAASGSGSKNTQAKSVKLQPGSPIFAALTTGDIELGTHGTVTMVNDETGEFYAFGHPFLGTGLTSIPISLSRVQTVVSNTLASYKLFETGGEIIGSLTKDFTYGVKGKLGPKPEMIPINYKLTYKAEVKPVKVEVAKIPDDWTNYLILVLSFYTLYGGYQEFNLARIDRYGYAITKATIKGDFSDITLASIIDYNLETADIIFFYYTWDIYYALQFLAKNKIMIRGIDFEVEYKTGKPNRLELDRAILDKGYVVAGDSVRISMTFNRKSTHDEINVTYKTVYTLFTPVEADTGTVAIQIKTGDNLSWSYREEPTAEEILREINSYTNLCFFVKADFSVVNKDTTPFILTDTSNLQVNGQFWQKREEKQKPIKKIVIFNKIIPPENVLVKANETLYLKIVSQAEYDKRKAEEKKAKKEEEAAKKKKKKFGIW